MRREQEAAAAAADSDSSVRSIRDLLYFSDFKQINLRSCEVSSP